MPLDGLADGIHALLKDIHRGLLEKATKMREEHTFVATDFAQFQDALENGRGFIKAMWCGERECEDAIKEKTGATTRCMPFAQEQLSDVCVHCGKPAKQMMYFATAY